MLPCCASTDGHNNTAEHFSNAIRETLFTANWCCILWIFLWNDACQSLVSTIRPAPDQIVLANPCHSHSWKARKVRRTAAYSSINRQLSPINVLQQTSATRSLLTRHWAPIRQFHTFKRLFIVPCRSRNRPSCLEVAMPTSSPPNLIRPGGPALILGSFLKSTALRTKPQRTCRCKAARP